MRKDVDYYARLHVSPDAPEEIIRASYRTLMQKLGAHPDLGGDHGYAQQLNEAYAVLKDPAKREAYDTVRGIRPAAAAPSQAPIEQAPRTGDTGMYAAVSESGTWAGPMHPAIRILEQCAFCGVAVPDSPLNPSTHCRNCGCPLTVAEQKVFDTSSRRAMLRISRHEAVTYRTHWRQREAMSGQLLDLSLTGMRFRTASPLAVGQAVAIDCAACEAVGRVVHGRPLAVASGSAFGIGLEFLTLDFKQRKGSLFTAPA